MTHKILASLMISTVFFSTLPSVYADTKNSTKAIQTKSGLEQFKSINVVLGQPQEVMARNLTAEQLAETMQKIMAIVDKNLSNTKIYNSMAIEVNFSPTTQNYSIGFKKKLDDKLIPAINKIKEELTYLSKIPTNEPLSFIIVFANEK